MLPNSEYTTFKFRVKKFIDEMPKAEAEQALKVLPLLLNMHPKSFSRFVNTKADSRYEPAADKILKLATFFNCTPYELYNVPPEEISINDINFQHKKDAINSFNLKPIQS